MCENAHMQLPGLAGHLKMYTSGYPWTPEKDASRVNPPVLKLKRNVESRYISNFDHMVATLGPKNAQGEVPGAQTRTGDAAQFMPAGCTPDQPHDHGAGPGSRWKANEVPCKHPMRFFLRLQGAPGTAT